MKIDKLEDKGLDIKNNDFLLNWISNEDYIQIRKWGYQKMSPFIWMAALTEEVGELSEAILKEHFDKSHPTRKLKIMKEAIQVATLALKIVDMIGIGKQTKK